MKQRGARSMEKLYRVQMNSKGMPNFATAEELQTKAVRYFDEDEKVWKMGEVIVADTPKTEPKGEE